MATIKTMVEMVETDEMEEILAEMVVVTAAGLLAIIIKVCIVKKFRKEKPKIHIDYVHVFTIRIWSDRPNRGRYGNFSEDGPRGGGGFDRNQREGSFNNREDR